MKHTIALLLAGLMSLSLAACGQPTASAQPAEPTEAEKSYALTDQRKGATAHTAKINADVYELLNFEDTSEAQNAVRGLIDAPEELELKDENGNVVWSQKAYAFLDERDKAPDTVNPSLWENSKNNHAYGLFEVMDGIYQVRGYDMANMTIIEGESGRIIYDVLMSTECAQAAMQLVEKNLGQRPIKAVLISHPHMDHFAGISGFVSEEEIADSSLPIEEQLASGKIPIIVPQGFHEHAVSENVYAGKAMGRRASYQYGAYLTPGETGRMVIGIGCGQSTGTVSYIPPTWEITQTGETLTIDGVEMEFQLTPGTEAPAEMNTWFPQKKALWMAENCTGTLHNLYTLRGAEIRSSSDWAAYILESLSRYGEDVQVIFQSHNWPHWGNDEAKEYLLNNAAVYQFIHDQTLCYINQGYTENEIANMIRLPKLLEPVWYTRQYYGTLAHDAKAVYQKYMGWYDANPVNLHPMAPADSAAKWAEYLTLGSHDAVMSQAVADFEKGEYQWVAQLTNTLVFADPSDRDARLLCADALEQLGYQAESGAWRNAYLTGARELREGNLFGTIKLANMSQSMLQNMSSSNFMDMMAIQLNAYATEEEDFTINFALTDTGETYAVRLYHGVMLKFPGIQSTDAAVTVRCPKNALLLLIGGKGIDHPSISIEGDRQKLQLFADNLTEMVFGKPADFNLVEP